MVYEQTGPKRSAFAASWQRLFNPIGLVTQAVFNKPYLEEARLCLRKSDMLPC